MLLILFFHEIGHLIFIKLKKLEVISITILPFGCYINCNIDKNKTNEEELIIYSAGVFINIILLILGLFLPFSDSFKTFNIILLIFNILPIYPLDGFMIITSILSNFMPYKKVMKLMGIISLLFLILLTFITVFFHLGLNSILFTIYLFKLTIDYLRYQKKNFKSFLLSKILYPNNRLQNKKINNDTLIIDNIYKGKNNYYILENKLIYEEEIIKFLLFQ